MLLGFLGGDIMKFASFTKRLSLSSWVLNATLHSKTSECTLIVAPVISRVLRNLTNARNPYFTFHREEGVFALIMLRRLRHNPRLYTLDPGQY